MNGGVEEGTEMMSIEQPACYRPNDDPYPLCRGPENPAEYAENDCIRCCLYENMIEEDSER